MDHSLSAALQSIVDLHNGTLSPDLVSESVRRLWFEEDDYSEGSLAFHLALARFPPPRAVDFYAVAAALINHRESHKVPNLLKLCREDLGPWQAALELEAGYRGGFTTPEAHQALIEAEDPFFQAVAWMLDARQMRHASTGDRVEIKRRLNQALEIFRDQSAFETGRALLYLSQVEAGYDTALKTAEEALEQFNLCKNRHYQSDTKQAIEGIREKYKGRENTRSRSVDLGTLIRPLLEADDTDGFFSAFIKVLTSRAFLALDYVTVLYKGVGGERIVAGHHAQTDKNIPTNSFDLGSGYRLVLSQAADPLALETILPLVKRELIRLSRAQPSAHTNYRRPFGRFVYYDSRMHNALDSLELAAKDVLEAAVMLRGEPGVGKTDLAYALHLQGCTRAGKFVVYDATTAVDKSFMVADLFGTVKGAFTDAQPRTGRIEEAANGTLFIDEIGELTPQCQALLLRVLQNREYNRMGTSESKPVTCRIILATNQPIEEWCRKPSATDSQPLFRQDLPSRFRHWIHIKSLHEIPDQIVPTAVSFLREQGEYSLSPDAEIYLRSVRWIGNYRSLQNAMGLAVGVAKLTGGKTITPEIIHRAIGHHPLLIAPLGAVSEPSSSGYMAPGFPMPSAMPAYPFSGQPAYPTAMPQPTRFPEPVAPPQVVPEAPPPPIQPSPPVFEAPPSTPASTESEPEPTYGSLDDEALRKEFIAQFKKVFDEFEFNRRKYFEFSILSNISQIIHQERFPREKTFNAVFSGLLRSPYPQMAQGRGAKEIEKLADLYRRAVPKWTPPQ